jgi:hypothetical protein
VSKRARKNSFALCVPVVTTTTTTTTTTPGLTRLLLDPETHPFRLCHRQRHDPFVA